MKTRFRTFDPHDTSALVSLSLAAWEPVYASFREALGTSLFELVYPDWKDYQAGVVERVCRSEHVVLWVAEDAGTVVGFIAYRLNHEQLAGEVVLLAVDPSSQKQGLATQLNALALDRMKEAGMERSELITGGDPGHAPARRSYERAGYSPFPLVRYYHDLRDDRSEAHR